MMMARYSLSKRNKKGEDVLARKLDQHLLQLSGISAPYMSYVERRRPARQVPSSGHS